MTTIKVLRNFRIVPLNGGGVCAIGTLDGADWKTTRIVGAQPGHVKTASGTVYQLVEPHVSLWAFSLQLKRPEEYKKLVDNQAF
jgi:hypothetical protein